MSKLVEFCFQLPLSYKRRNGIGRYLIRQYLKTQAPEAIYMKLQKKGGIIPATLSQCQQYLAEGRFDTHFNELPYLDWATQNSPHQTLAARIHTYMFKSALDAL